MIGMAFAGMGLGLLKTGMQYSSEWDRAHLAASAQREQTREQIRRMTLDFERTRSEAEALGAASGMTTDSESLTKYLADMNNEFTRQRDFLRRAGDANLDAIGMQMKAATYNAIGDIGGTLFSFGQANNWFRQPSVG